MTDFRGLSKAVVSAVKSSELVDMAKECTEIGLDAVLQDGLVKDLPIVSALVGAFNTGLSIRDRFLAHKILRFLEGLSSLSDQERKEMVDKLDEEDGYRHRVGEQVIEILERLQVDKQPEMAAKAFKAFAEGGLSYLQLRRILGAIERLPLHEHPFVRQFWDATIAERMQLDKAALLALQSSGLAMNSGGFDGGVLLPTETFELFIALDLDR